MASGALAPAAWIVSLWTGESPRANLKPEDKPRTVRQLAERIGHAALLGEGVNDAPTLAEASVGVAKRTRPMVQQNIALPTMVIGILVVGALAGAFTLPVAVLGHEINEFIVAGSGLGRSAHERAKGDGPRHHRA